MTSKDKYQRDGELERILYQIKPWGIQRQDVHKGASKRVYVKGPTHIEPKQPWAYLTSVKQSMAHPETLVKEYKYTRYLHERFPEWIVEELPLAEENRPLAKILNAHRGLLITKKPIVRNSIGPNSTLDELERLLVYMMVSTDALIDAGFANLDLKVTNIGITDKLRINDNGSNMFYPIPDDQKEYYRDAIKLVGLLNLGIKKPIFDKYKEYYPTLNFNRAFELFMTRNVQNAKAAKEQDEKEHAVKVHAKTVMEHVMVDGQVEDLSSLFDHILFPVHVLNYYGTKGTFDILVFIEKLERMGLVPDPGSVTERRIQGEKRIKAEQERAERERIEHQKERDYPGTSEKRHKVNTTARQSNTNHNTTNRSNRNHKTTNRSRPSSGNGHSKSKRRANATASPQVSNSQASNPRASSSRTGIFAKLIDKVSRFIR